MKIIAIRPAPPGGATDIALFDLELPDGITLYNLTLARARDGGLRVWAPNMKGGLRAAAFRTDVARNIADLALFTWKDRIQNADFRAA